MSDLACNITLASPLTIQIQLNAVGSTSYLLPTATSITKGGIVIGARLTMTGDVLSADVQGSTYTLPVATALILGGVKKGDRVSIDAAGVISADVQTTDISGKVDKITGSSLVPDTEIAKIHSLGADAETITTIGAILNGASAETPGDSDTFNFYQAIGAVLKKVTWANIKSVFALAGHNHSGTYQPVGSYLIASDITGKVNGPANNTVDYIPQWNGTDSKTLKDGLAVPAGGLAGLTALGGKQDALVSGTNIKTVGGVTVLGSGDIEVSSGIWKVLTGAYASVSTFTFTGTDKDVNLIQFSLFTCTDSAGTTRRIGYVKSSVNNAGTITATVVTDTNLAVGDKDFKVAYNRKVDDYIHLISIPGEVIADASYSQGLWRQNLKANSYLLPVDFSVLTAAAGAGASCTMNVYKNTTALFSSAPDLGTNTVLVEQRPTTNTLSAAESISLRIMSSAGATNKAADFQAKLYLVPTLIYTAF